MRATLKWVGIASLGLCGCAATSGGAGIQLASNAQPEGSSVRIGQSRILDAHVNPMVPVHLATEGGSVAVTFGQAGRRGAVARVDPNSLELLSHEQTGPSEVPAAPSTDAARVDLEGDRFVVCWTRASADGGREAVAQMWSTSGSPLGAAMVISPPDADVFGSPRATTTDGQHVLVTFPETYGTSFELRAVSLQDADRADSNRMARR